VVDRAGLITMHDPSGRARSRILRPAVLLLVVAIHAALLLVASRRLMRVDTRSEEPLIFLALPEHAQVLAPGASQAALPRKKQVAPHDTQLITIPAPAQQPAAADKNPAPIDWNNEVDLAIKQRAELAMAPAPRALDKHGAGADLNGGLGPDPKGKVDFGWDHSHTHRVETIEGGGILIHINDRCVLVLFPLPFAGCGIGKIPVRGDLFDHMHDEPQADGSRKNIAP
jgi:hypothetical protein